MKRIVFFIAIVVGVLMASCSLDQEVQVTPSVAPMPRKVAAKVRQIIELCKQ